MKKYIVFAILILPLWSAAPPSSGVIVPNTSPSILNSRVLLINKTPQEFTVKLVNLESTQEENIELLKGYVPPLEPPKLHMSLPPGLYAIQIVYPPTGKVVTFTGNALRSAMSATALCVQLTLTPSLSIDSPLVAMDACS